MFQAVAGWSGKEAWERGDRMLAGPCVRDLCPSTTSLHLSALLCDLRGWPLPTSSSLLASSCAQPTGSTSRIRGQWERERPEYFFPRSPPSQNVLTMAATSTKGHRSCGNALPQSHSYSSLQILVPASSFCPRNSN